MEYKLFKLDKPEDFEIINGTSFHAVTISATPNELIATFGPSQNTDDYKVSCEWVFVDEDNMPFTVYDWKVTSLYDEDYPAPSQLKDVMIRFHIGSRFVSLKEEENFRDWLMQRIEQCRSLRRYEIKEE